jgi:phytoene synthase
MAVEPSADDIAYATALVRAHDRPRYYATLFAPSAVRADLFALYGFAAEIARVPDQVSEPALGEIRLQWWRDALADRVAGGGEGSAPALRAAAHAIAHRELPLAPLEALIDARSADLYSDLPARLVDIEGRMGETESALFQMAAIILGASGPETAEAAGHAGIAYGLARRLATFAAERARGRTILPADLLAQEGLSAADAFAARPSAKLHNVIVALMRHAYHHLRLAGAALPEASHMSRFAFLPLAIVVPLLKRIERLQSEITQQDASLPDLEMLVRIGWARLRGL